MTNTDSSAYFRPFPNKTQMNSSSRVRLYQRQMECPFTKPKFFLLKCSHKIFPKPQIRHGRSSRLLRITSLTRPAFVKPPVAIPRPFQLRRILTKVPLYKISVHIYRLRPQVLRLFSLLNPF